MLLSSFLIIQIVIPGPNLGHWEWENFFYSVLIIHLLQIQSEGQWEPSNEVRFLSLGECTMGFGLETSRFQM